MTAVRTRPVRVRLKHLDWLEQNLGERDQKIVTAVGRLRLMTSMQLERLHFMDIPVSHRARSRRRVLKRLTDWRVLRTLERRIGGVRAGSSGLIYCLDTAGRWLADREQRVGGADLAPRRPEQPSGRLVNHTLGLAELYVRLVEYERRGQLRLVTFEGEPDCWVANGVGGWLKPDAYAVVATADVTDYWWLEHDEATESLPTMRRKLVAYLDFLRRGQIGPDQVMPRVLVSVPSEARAMAVHSVITGLPEPGAKLLAAVTHEQAAGFIAAALRE